MGLFKGMKDMKDGIAGAKDLGQHHGGMPSIGGAFKDLKALSDDRGQGEILKDGTPAKAIVKSFAMPSPTEKFAMQIDLEIHPQSGEAYQVTYTYPTARQKAAMSIGMEIPVKVHPQDPSLVAVQWDALKGAIAASGGDMAAVMQGLQGTYAGTADAAMRAHAAGTMPPMPGMPMPGGTAPAPTPAPAAAAPAQTPTERLAKLGELRDQQLISEADYETKKAEILADL
jgi:hypothetical protein